MAQTFDLQQTLSRLAALRQQQEQLQSQPVQQGLLREGQSFSQLFTDPSQAQRAALLQTGLSLLSSTDQPNLLANIGNAAQSGLTTLAGARAARRQGELAAIQEQQKAAQQDFENQLRLSTFERAGGPEGEPAQVRTVRALAAIADDETKPQTLREGARRALGALARQGTLSAAERIPETGVTEQVAGSQQRIAERTAEGKATGKAIGEARDELASLQANMPQLEQTVATMLPDLQAATSTFAGKTRDVLLKELDQPASDAAKARARLKSQVSNTMMPLLKATFPGAISDAEREALLDTMLDIDASPDEKVQYLNAFIAQKRLEVQTRARRHGLLSGALSPEAVEAEAATSAVAPGLQLPANAVRDAALPPGAGTPAPEAPAADLDALRQKYGL